VRFVVVRFGPAEYGVVDIGKDDGSGSLVATCNEKFMAVCVANALDVTPPLEELF
jgi:hypothetical protein